VLIKVKVIPSIATTNAHLLFDLSSIRDLIALTGSYNSTWSGIVVAWAVILQHTSLLDIVVIAAVSDECISSSVDELISPHLDSCTSFHSSTISTNSICYASISMSGGCKQLL
jgi:hypothetical protein